MTVAEAVVEAVASGVPLSLLVADALLCAEQQLGH